MQKKKNTMSRKVGANETLEWEKKATKNVAAKQCYGGNGTVIVTVLDRETDATYMENE